MFYGKADIYPCSDVAFRLYEPKCPQQTSNIEIPKLKHHTLRATSRHVKGLHVACFGQYQLSRQHNEV